MTDTAIYTSAAATAKRLLSKFGAPAWLHHPDGGSGIYDPNTGTVTAPQRQRIHARRQC